MKRGDVEKKSALQKYPMLIRFIFICCAQAFKAIQLKRWWTSFFVGATIRRKKREHVYLSCIHAAQSKLKWKKKEIEAYILLSLTIQGTIFPGITFQFETIDRTNDARTRCMKTQTKDQSQFAIKVVYTWRLAQHNRFGYVNICIYRENVRVCASVFWLKIYRA